MESDVDVLMTDWFRRVRESQRTHYECGTRYSRFNKWLGIPTIVLTVIVGTTVFSTLDKQATGRMKITLGGLSVIAAVLASLQTFMSYSSLAERHRITGSKYGAIRRKLEMMKTFTPEDNQELKRGLEEIKQAMDELAEQSPHVPSSMKRKIDREMKSRDHRRVFVLNKD